MSAHVTTNTKKRMDEIPFHLYDHLNISMNDLFVIENKYYWHNSLPLCQHGFDLLEI